ncbi:hypothetical protein [Streptomyces ipomoeae]|uniref:hypothetical protein n=1 Tax=Streptomyces ipomoeae TaxID=103232 RepID=UPI0011479131|nr:hypothetical protein [Streptomyces ipomoeae]TQE35481.1 hypothetical protein Sipo7851_14565 [Streptomyces ipomoeae]
MPHIVPYMESIQYDGTNAEYICGTWANVGLGSVDETKMVILITGDSVVPYDVPVGYWLVKNSPFSGEPSIHSPEQYAARYIETTPSS